MPSSVHTDEPGARLRGRDLLRTVAEGTAGAVGDEFLHGLVRQVSLAFDAKFAFVAEAKDPGGRHVEVISGWYDGGWLAEPLEYDTRGKPCALVVERAVVSFPEELTTIFPEAKPAIDMGLESYLAVCLRASDGTHLGHMAVMDAQPMVARDDEAADVLRLAHDELDEAQAELRDLARGLHPVALTERGLRDALESLVAGSDIPVTLDVAADDLPEDVELAAYFIASESLTNARRYAEADMVRVEVARVGDALVIEIVDDGRGGADPAAGTGLRGLADRIDALGGRLTVDSAPGAGTRVTARLPLRPDA